MSLPTYTIALDSDDDGTYATDLTDYVLQVEPMEWSHGMNDPQDNMAREATFDFVLNNAGNQFSPSHASAMSGFQVGKKIKLTMTYGTTETKFVGRILPDGIQPTLGIYRERRTQVRCGSFMYVLHQQLAECPTSQDISTGTAIQYILENMDSFPPVVVRWVMGQPGFSDLGNTTVLGAGITDFADLDTGAYTFNYFGDNLKEGTTVYEALREIVETEDGLLFMDETGKLIFRDSNYLVTQQTEAAAATLVGTDIIEGEDLFGSQLINKMTVTFYPREVGTPNTRVGSYGETLVFDYYDGVNYRHNAQTFTIPYTDQDTGLEIGALDIITPVSPTHWQAYHLYNPTLDLSAYFIVETQDVGWGLEVTMYHTSSLVPAIDYFYVNGTPLTDYGRNTFTVQDDDSIAAYGLAEVNIRRKFMDNRTYAENWALWQLHQYKTPGDVLEKLTIVGNRSATHWAWVRDLAVGDMIEVSEGQTGISGTSYFIVGTQHRVLEKEHRLTLILRPAPPAAWVLGEEDFSEVGETTILGLGV